MQIPFPGLWLSFSQWITAAAVLARVSGLFETYMKAIASWTPKKENFPLFFEHFTPPPPLTPLSNFWMRIAPGLNQKKDEQNPCKLTSAQMALVTNSPSNFQRGARSPGFSLTRPFHLLRCIGVSHQAREGHVSSSSLPQAHQHPHSEITFLSLPAREQDAPVAFERPGYSKLREGTISASFLPFSKC